MTRKQQKMYKAVRLASDLEGAIRDIRGTVCADNLDAQNECEMALDTLLSLKMRLHDIVEETGVNPFC